MPFAVPSIVNNPDYGQIVVLAQIPYEDDFLVIFQDSQGLTTFGFFNGAGDAIARPVRFKKNSSGLYEFDFPGADASRFVLGPGNNVTPCA